MYEPRPFPGELRSWKPATYVCDHGEYPKLCSNGKHQENTVYKETKLGFYL